MQTDGKDATKTKMNAQEIVKQINYNDWCKNYVNNAILEDLGIRRIRTSNNLLFPIDTYRRCRRQLLSHDERYESIYYATKLHENREITIEKNLLFTSILDTASGEVIAQCNKAQRGK
jgi:DNA-directed RNA polymerase subunit N (RpoN/RPB10)